MALLRPGHFVIKRSEVIPSLFLARKIRPGRPKAMRPG
jgi:hypothetical protein